MSSSDVGTDDATRGCVRGEQAFSPPAAPLCHHFCGLCLCKYLVRLTQNHLVALDPEK